MKYVSTRDPSREVTLSDAIRLGLAPDGGLFVPTSLPTVDLSGASTIAEVGGRLLAPFFDGDPLAAELDAIITSALDFDIPTVAVDDDLSMLELFHGPTAAFKDVGARFLAECMARIPSDDPRPATIVTATSGDTGAAVASAFFRRDGFEVVILYPDGRVSERQAHQLSVWGENIRTYKVSADFDACQRVAKEAFVDETWRGAKKLTSANSINIGRMLPQMVYHALSAVQRPGTFVVPTGNLGNALAAIMARACGAPIGDIVLATNANRAVADYLESGKTDGNQTIATLANAMDVGKPSNLERLVALFPDKAGLLAHVVDDRTIESTIRAVFEAHGRAICPHTACAFAAPRPSGPVTIVATAHPAKFESIVEPLIGQPVEVPERLADLLARPAQAKPLEPSLAALAAAEL